ncbi:MAG: alpha/beta hydrolase fold domain-containing protein [Solobacterium sp.]|nr:alpha/beta hydrolase fold domain-containing protein [Solobacterium sp.]
MITILAILGTVSLAIFGVLYSLLGYNNYFRMKVIEWMTREASVRGMKKEDVLHGRRMYIMREDKRSVRVNYYQHQSREPVPVIFMIHGSDFASGDADDIDGFCDELRKKWKMSVVSINYTKIPVHQSTYPQEEILDVIMHFSKNAAAYGMDKNRFILFGTTAGAYLAMLSSVMLVRRTVIPCGYIFCTPWIDYVQISFARIQQHPGPVALAASGSDRQILDCEEYAYELDRAGMNVYMKSYADMPEDFIEKPEGLTAEQLEIRESALNILHEDAETFFNLGRRTMAAVPVML